MPGPFDSISPLVHKYASAPPGFDPRNASDRELADYGLPERPDAGADPVLVDFWDQMLAPGTEVLEPQFPWDTGAGATTASVATAPVAVTQQPLPRAVVSGHRESSENWSGAYMTPLPRPNRFVRVMASWRVPKPMIPAVPPLGTGAGSVYRSSTWVGTGGHRSYNSLPQIGTSQDVWHDSGGEVVCTRAWWQWWIKNRKQHDEPIFIDNFHVAVGDEILASVSVEAPLPGDVRFNLKNQRTGKIIAFKVRAPADILPLGATAEWVHERPTHVEEIFPLPRCTDVVFNHCLALNAPDFGALSHLQTLGDQCRLIRMTSNFGTPSRSAFISTPTQMGATGLRITYEEAVPAVA